MTGRQWSYIVTGNGWTQTNGIIKNERGEWNFKMTGNDRSQTNGIIKKIREGGEIS